MLLTIISVLVLVWVYTGIGKLTDFNSFRGAILNQPFPNDIGEYVSILIPIIEVVLAILLINTRTRVIGLVGSIALLSAFSTYVGLVWVGSFERVPCGCAGIIEQLGWKAHFILNLSLLILAMIGILMMTRTAMSPKQ
ncbi:hypothetical protein MM213_00045 [Belliella sp. R4-6]|uniref:Methylamine utilisation protein MauE domain-containing protein n=1 Tax=Belliella alkalica TaxID=1730871 RepID=A0ABS9V614_9BACT|nr:hypothetical protein [Belliella alkalica]